MEAQAETKRARDQQERADLQKRLLEVHGDIWTVKQAAEYLQVDERRLRAEIDSGRLGYFNPTGGQRGRKILYSDLCDYIMRTRKVGRG